MIVGDVLGDYSFFVLWNPVVFLSLILIGTVYLLIVGPLRYLFDRSAAVSPGKKLLFLGGLGTLYIALGTPLHVAGDSYLFSAHMLEQSLVYMVAPPLLLLGTPEWLLRPLWDMRWLRPLLSFVFHPLVAMLAFNSLFSLYHVPVVFNYVTSNSLLHSATHFLLLIASFQMWWMIVSPLPEQGRLSELRKMGYIVINGILLYPACALIIFADAPLYSAYQEAPRLVPVLNALHDQQLGGVIMKLLQEGVFIVALGYLFLHWYRRENRESNAEMA